MELIEPTYRQIYWTACIGVLREMVTFAKNNVP